MASFVLLRVVPCTVWKKTPLFLPCFASARASPVGLFATVTKGGRLSSISSHSQSFPLSDLPSLPHVTQEMKNEEEEKEVVKNKEEELKKMGEGGGVEANEVEESFADLLRSSKLVSSGQIVGRCVPALITAVSGDDLYVDFGSKFHAVVPCPKGDTTKWRRGVWVEVKVNELELTQHFLGSSRHSSLLEADVELMGLLRSSS